MPGGKSPMLFFKKVINSNIDWDSISILATDDRVDHCLLTIYDGLTLCIKK